MTAVAFPILLLIALVMIEMLILAREHPESVDWHDVVFNLNSGHLMLWLFRGLEIAVYGLILGQFSTGLVESWPAWAVWLLAIVMWDFCFYWLHRLHHKFRVLWAIHLVHHEGEHFNLSLAVRNSWYSSLASIPFFIPMALLGIPLEAFITVSVVHYGIQLMNHSALTPNLGFLEKILVTPAHHRIHHVKDRAYSDTNYAGSFVIWDKLFGTYRPDLPEGEFEYGVKGEPPSRNPALASNLPFLRLLRLRSLRLARRRPQFESSGLWIMAATVVLFLLVSLYIWQYGYGYGQDLWRQLSLFGLLAAGAVALGGISEGRSLSLWAWAGLSWALLLAFGGENTLWLLGCLALCLHSTAMLLGLGRKAL